MRSPPETIGPYRLLSVFSRSSVASVYRAEHGETGHSVALKAIEEPWEAFLPTIRREIRLLERIRHPGIVRILDSGLHDGLPWFAMELVEGASLRLHAKALPHWRERLPLMLRLCAPLSYLHGEGILHRDLKPENVVVRADGEAVLVDFGVAGRFGSELSRESLEVEVDASGTLLYMAPEQIRGELLDARADLYSLGCMLFELVTGRPPFDCPTNSQLIEAHLHSAPPRPASLVPDIPESLQDLLLRLLSKDPGDRMGYADDVAVALMELGAEGPVDAGPKARAYLYRSRMAGRQAALAEVQGHLERDTRLVLVGGESGIGKTRLVMEAARAAERGGARVLIGECLPVTADKPGEAVGNSPLQALRKPLQAIADRCRERGREETDRLLGRRGKLLALYEPAFVGLPGQDQVPEPPALPSEAARRRLYSYLAATFQMRAQDGPLLLVIDDLQWADELTLGFLEFARQAWQSGEQRSDAISILATYRSEEVGPRLRTILDDPEVSSVELTRLEESAVGAMVAEMLSLRDRPELFTRWLTRHSEGNPFFVAEYLRAAVAEGVLHRDKKGRWQIAAEPDDGDQDAPYEGLAIPVSVRDLVGRRLEGLTPDTRRLLELAAVLGREVDSTLFENLASKTVGASLDGIDELLRRQVLRERKGGRLRFEHDKIREVAYERIDLPSRKVLHRAAAEGIELHFEGQLAEHLGALGQHWEQAGEPVQARQRFLAGARLARDRYAYSEAERLYRGYLRLVETPDTESMTARNELGFHVFRNQGRAREAYTEHERSLEDARRLGERRILSDCLNFMGVIHRELGELAEAGLLHEQAFELQRAMGRRHGQAMTLHNLALVRAEQGHPEQARELYERTLVLKRELGDPGELARTLGNLGVLDADQGRPAEARTYYEQAIDLIRTTSDRHLLGATLGNLAELLADSGDSQAAFTMYEEALAIHRESENRPYEGMTLSYLANLHAGLGRFEEARSAYQRALQIHRKVLDRRNEAITQVRHANLERRTGQFTEAHALLERARAILEAINDAINLVVCLCETGHLALYHGRDATPYLQQSQELASKLQVASESEPRRAIARLQRAHQASREGRPLWRGELVNELSELLRRRLSDEGHLGT